MSSYPDDSDGDALRSIEAQGNDMSASMEIDFPVLFPSEGQASVFAPVAASLGFRVHLSQDEKDLNWDVYCTCDMVPEYEEIVRIQHELTAAAKPYGGYSDGWGTFGNKE